MATFLHMPKASEKDVINSLIDRSITEITSDVATVGARAFNSCAQLTKADLSKCTSIAENGFAYCTNLNTLILRNNAVCSLASASGSFTGTKLYDKKGSIYVPASLVSSYKNHSAWSHFSTIIKSIDLLG